jgi:hypothetical protein
MSTVVLFRLNTVRYVKCVKKLDDRVHGMYGGRRVADWVCWKNLRDRDKQKTKA